MEAATAAVVEAAVKSALANSTLACLGFRVYTGFLLGRGARA